MKANNAERVILTLKHVLFRYFTKNRTHRFIDKLQDFVKSYNSTPHSSLAYKAPKDVNDNNQSDLWAYMYLKKQKLSKNSLKEPKKIKRHFIFRKGDMVRISHLSRVFQKSYEQQWTSEIFKIAQRFLFQCIPMYKINDFTDELIRGNFHASELQKVVKDENTLWYVEKNIRKRKRNGLIEWLVKFEGWPDKYSSWIPERDIT